MLIALAAGIAGLLAGVIGAVAWTAGFRQGRRDVLAITRALSSESGHAGEQSRRYDL